MTKYTSMTPREAGAEFHRIWEKRDAFAMDAFIFDHRLDETDGMYVRDHDRTENDGFVTWRFLLNLADEQGNVRHYILVKDTPCRHCIKARTMLYEVRPKVTISEADSLDTMVPVYDLDSSEHIFNVR